MDKNTFKDGNGGNKTSSVVGFFATIVSILNGKILTGTKAINSLPFLLFLTGIAFLLIMNSYYAEKKGRATELLRDELVEMRTRHILTRSELMYLSNQSAIARRVSIMGLYESRVPPMVVDGENRDFGVLNSILN